MRGILQLPHPSLIRKWSASVNYEPGFLSEAFQSLGISAKECPGRKEGALMLDGMTIQKQTTFDTTRDQCAGFTEYGGVLPEPCEQLAFKALVFLLAYLRGHWKSPNGCLLINCQQMCRHSW